MTLFESGLWLAVNVWCNHSRATIKTSKKEYLSDMLIKGRKWHHTKCSGKVTKSRKSVKKLDGKDQQINYSNKYGNMNETTSAITLKVSDLNDQ